MEERGTEDIEMRLQSGFEVIAVSWASIGALLWYVAREL